MIGGKLLLFTGISVLILFSWMAPKNVFEATGINENPAFSTSPHILYVGGTGPNNYTKIQDAINAASDGDTIYVFNGTYYENVVVNKSITLMGENKYSTIIDRRGNGDVVNITSNNVTIQEFTVINNGWWWTGTNNGIKIWYSSNVAIKNCSIKDNELGITLYSSHNNIISNCNISNNDYGIELVSSSSNNTISNCSIYSNSNYGISFSSSPHNIISNCNISNNNYGIILSSSNNNTISNCNIYSNYWDGISIYSSYSNTISNCNIYSNDEYGISFSSSYNNIVSNCNISHSADGIRLDSSSNNTISNCNIYSNYWDGIYLDSSYNNSISYCNMSNNGIFIRGDALSHFIHNIHNNTVNGKPLLYYKNEENIALDGNAGQIILANCSNFGIKNINLNDTSVGLEIAYCNNISISYCQINNSDAGMVILYSSDIEIYNWYISNNNEGLVVLDSSNISIEKGILCYSDAGVELGLVDNIYLANCSIHDSTWGIDAEEKISNITIFNCTLYNNGGWKGSSAIGIYLADTLNIYSCSIFDNNVGVVIGYSNNTTIDNCEFRNNTWGLGFGGCNSNTNIVKNCFFYGDNLEMMYSENITVINNTFLEGGIIIEEGMLSHFIHNIHNNTVNGKPLLYYKNEKNVTLDGVEAGQIILVNCSNFEIKNMDIHNTDVGIEIAYCNNISMSYCQITNNSWYGIYLYSSHNNSISYCNISNNMYGIEIDSSSNNFVFYCNIYDNKNYGVISPNLVNASYNWWGSIKGPFNPTLNPDGKGDNVSGNVIFKPWLFEAVVTLIEDVYYQEIGYGENIINATNVDLKAAIECTENNSINIIKYDEPPVEAPNTVKSVGKYISISTENESAVKWPIFIQIYYTQEDLKNAGLEEEQLVGIYFYNESSKKWELYNDTGINMTDAVVNGKEYAGYAWANAWHLTKLTMCADVIPPDTTYIIEGNRVNSEWYTSNVTVLFNATDDISVKTTKYQIDKGGWKEYNGSFSISSEGEHIIEFYSVDNAGNEEEVKNITIKIDKITPQTAYYVIPSLNRSNDWYTSNVTIILNATDNVSGVNVTYYSIDNGSWQEYTGNIVISSEGEHIIEFYSVDNAGNEEEVKNITLKIDRTSSKTAYSLSPSNPDGKNGWYISNVTLKLNAYDNISGIDAIYYKINDREWKKYSNPIKLTFDGVYTIKYYSIDNAGNREETKSITVKIEKSKPSLIIEKPENGIYLFDRKVFPFCKPLIIGKITIRVNAGNSTSGIDRVEFYVDNKLKYTDEEEPYEWTYDEGAIFRHRHYITVKVVDTAGKEAEITQRIWIFNI